MENQGIHEIVSMK
jgi:hypothetical protein